MKKLWSNYSYVIILLALSFVFAFSTKVLTQPADQHTYNTVTIQEGDSLWEIAGDLSERTSMGRGDIIEWMKKHNSLEGEVIFPGEELLVPVKKLGQESGTELASAGKDE